MIITSLSVDDTLKENVVRSDASFPHSALYVNPLNYPEKYISWHWHPELEFNYVLHGTIEISTSNNTYLLHPGEGAYVNSNVLHTMRPVSGECPSVLCQLFDMRLIAGSYNGLIEQKYIRPIIENKNIEVLLLHPATVNQRKILELVRSAYDTADQADYGYEIMVRNHLSAAWMLMCQELKSSLHPTRIARVQDETRIKQMMLFIQHNYTQKIELEDIAASASISKRECLRCFRSNLGTTPFTYLVEYRVHMAARLLLETDKTVTDIAYETGFAAPSYFGKKFRSVMDCTPLEYRRNKQIESRPSS